MLWSDFSNFDHVAFYCMDWKAPADKLFFGLFLAIEVLLADTLNELLEMQVLETSEEFREKTILHVIEENCSRLGFQCEEPTHGLVCIVSFQKKKSLTTCLEKNTGSFGNQIRKRWTRN